MLCFADKEFPLKETLPRSGIKQMIGVIINQKQAQTMSDDLKGFFFFFHEATKSPSALTDEQGVQRRRIKCRPMLQYDDVEAN